MEKKYTVSVLMPVWNQEDLVLRALKSIPERVDEIIIVDDGSTDLSLEIIKAWARTRSNVKIFSNHKNMGVGYSINRCYNEATCDYTVILSSDDYFHPAMNRLLNHLDGSDMVFFNVSYNVPGRYRRPTPQNYKNWAGSCKLVRRKFMEGVRASDAPVNEDKELFQLLLAKPHTTKFTGILAKHYNTPRIGSLTDRKQRGEFGEEYVSQGIERRWAAYDRHYGTRLGLSPDDLEGDL